MTREWDDDEGQALRPAGPDPVVVPSGYEAGNEAQQPGHVASGQQLNDAADVSTRAQKAQQMPMMTG
jgi:hypothetical protein